MKQDLKRIIRIEMESHAELPENHRHEFIEKLKSHNSKPKKISRLIKMASIVLILLSIGTLTILHKPPMVDEEPLLTQLKDAERNYLTEIDKEWMQFVALSNDDKLKNRFEKKFEGLQSDYLLLARQFKEDPNNLILLESLIDNLQTRLQLLKDIQKHINLLNQKNEHYENNM